MTAELMDVREMREYVKTGSLPTDFRARVRAAVRRVELEEELDRLQPTVFENVQGEKYHVFPTVPEEGQTR